MINREDMLELTRRMTSSRTHFIRIAGAYIDEEGYIDGTFNRNFMQLSNDERAHLTEIAKTIPFAQTNKELKEYRLPVGAYKTAGIWQLLYAIRDCDLKNDALLLNLYEIIAEEIEPGEPYAIYIYEGIYDITVKASDKERLDGSDEVYKYLICAICKTENDYEVEPPTTGFLWPVFKERSTVMNLVNVLDLSEKRASDLKRFLAVDK